MHSIIKALPKGQITIPAPFRKALNINNSTLLKAELVNDGILLRPITVDWKDSFIREYSDIEINNFITRDALSKDVQKKLKNLIS